MLGFVGVRVVWLHGWTLARGEILARELRGDLRRRSDLTVTLRRRIMAPGWKEKRRIAPAPR
jgi:hypothetical protein